MPIAERRSHHLSVTTDYFRSSDVGIGVSIFHKLIDHGHHQRPYTENCTLPPHSNVFDLFSRLILHGTVGFVS